MSMSMSMSKEQIMRGPAIAQEAFETALATGRLTETMGQPNYVGDYMYMGTHPKTGRAAFKHRDTREYLK